MHRCAACPYTSAKKCNVERHRLRVHVQGKQFECRAPGCAHRTASLTALQTHMKRRHSAAKLRPASLAFRCPHCAYEATYASRMEQHMRTHTGERPFGCTHCPYRARFRIDLTRHLQRHSDVACSASRAVSSRNGVMVLAQVAAALSIR